MSNRILPDDPPWLKAAFKDNGLREIAGAKHNPRVIEMFRKAGHPEVSDDETAWCAAAVGCWLYEGGMKNTGSLMARSYATYGIGLPRNRLYPRGAIVVWPRGRPPSGHVNLVLADDGTTLTCIGGNQSPAPGAVSISRTAKAAVLAVRWPKNYPLPATPMPKAEDPVETDSEDPLTFTDLSAREKLPWWKRAWTWVSGGGIATVAGGIFDWRVAAVLGGIGLLVFLVVWFTFLRKRLEKEP